MSNTLVYTNEKYCKLPKAKTIVKAVNIQHIFKSLSPLSIMMLT